MSETINAIEKLLPNREEVRHFVWGELTAPLETDVHNFLIEKIDEYGSWKEKHDHKGNLIFSGWIYKNKKQGRWLNFYKTGKPHKDCFYKYSLYHGFCTIWDLDGNYTSCMYYKGKRDGEEKFYNSDGTLRCTRLYKMGSWCS